MREHDRTDEREFRSSGQTHRGMRLVDRKSPSVDELAGLPMVAMVGRQRAEAILRVRPFPRSADVAPEQDPSSEPVDDLKAGSARWDRAA